MATDRTDEHRIRDLVARFDDAVNRRDVPEFEALWAEDARWEIGAPMAMKVEGREAIVAMWARMIEDVEWLFRGSFVGVLEIDGDTAKGRWPCIETGTFRKTPNAPARGYDNRAFYQDHYIRIDGRWLFKSRSYVYLWLSNDSLPGAPLAIGDGVTGDWNG